MTKKTIVALILLMIICTGLFSQNRLANTTWETITDGTRQTIVFGETGFRWTGEPYQLMGTMMPGRNEVGTYKVEGEMVYLSIPRFTYTGILLGNTLNISGGLVGWEFRRVQPNSTGSSSSTQNLPSIRIKNSTGYTIYYLYVTPTNNKSWGNDLLGDKVLRVGETINVTLPHPLNSVNRYDIHMEDLDEDTYTKMNVQITANGVIEFTIRDLDGSGQ